MDLSKQRGGSSFFQDVCKRRDCGGPREIWVSRTWISRSSAFVLFFEMLEKEKLVEAQVKFWLQGHGSLEAAPLCQGNESLDENF